MPQPASPAITLEPLRNAHLPAAHQLSLAAGWPHREEDWANLLSVSSGVAVIAGGQLVGTGICTRFEGRARLNMIIVSQTMRSRGLGRRIIEALVALAGDIPMSLTATEDGFPLYRKFGFEPASTVSQFQGTLQIPAGEAGTIRKAGVEDMSAIIAMDKDATGAGRTALLHSLAARGEILLTEGGFACLVPFGRGKVLGPVVASNIDVARRLLRCGLRDCAGQFVRMDTDPALGLAADLMALGLAPVGDGTVMHRGTPPKPKIFTAYALASQAVG